MDLSKSRSGLENGAMPVQPEAKSLTLILGRPDTGSFRGYLAGQKQGWWDAVGKDALVDDALTYVELESEATKVRTFKVDLIDGLLQTNDYAAAVARANLPSASEEIVHRRVDVRTRRQERLTGDKRLYVEAVLTEGSLRTQVGGPEVMRRQLERLLELAELPNVDIRVVPASGAYPAMGTPFYLLSFPGGFPDIGYIELLDKGVYLEEADDVEPYVRKFNCLLDMALAARESAELIAEMID
jgi:hypothetical protein